ncbi:H-NS family nucleoid-associated regulatory protein [Paraburkholderia sp. SARCC-3016]|uniref:H-NS histone family protein n=1 Tax=Paraburkholderia sp. SARCC-3016 TaxID=3058611 RepID=UPI0028086086|nr:H-NS family nucleoid-associated regulatory protein [Paraburkholderia sp. SARCC-3016]MDQ7977063.1 H-NS family nucleoid-associated regulatory protein [Paraburkholderia sp. SARCC-3016]
MATLEQIQTRLKKLQAQADAIIAKRAQGALDQIRELMIKHGLTTRDIEARSKARRERARLGLANGKTKSAGATKGKLPPKYRDPKTGATWSGHARPPAWIKNVKDRTRFLIDGGSAAAGASVKPVAKPAKKAAAKKATAKKAAAKKSIGRKSVAAKKTAARKTAVGSVAAKKTAGRKGAAKKLASGRTAAGKTAKKTTGETARKAPVRKTGRGTARKVTAHTAPVAAPAAANGALALS